MGLDGGHLSAITLVICAKSRVCVTIKAFQISLRLVKKTMVLPLLHSLWSDDQGQDIAEYAVMLAVILVIVVGTIRMIGSNANTVFSSAASSIQ